MNERIFNSDQVVEAANSIATRSRSIANGELACLERIGQLGDAVANDLRVDSGGLRAGAFSSEILAAELSSGALDTAAHGPTHTGVSAMDAVVWAVRARQSARVRAQACRMLTGAGQFETADDQSAGGLAELM